MKVLSLEQLLGATLSTNQMLALQQSQLVPIRTVFLFCILGFCSHWFLRYFPSLRSVVLVVEISTHFVLRHSIEMRSEEFGAGAHRKCPVKISRHSRGTENLSVQYNPDPGCSKAG